MSKFTTIRVRTEVMEKYRSFCDDNNLAVGKFTESLLEEVMEDAFFARRADAALRQSLGKPLLSHDDLRNLLEDKWSTEEANAVPKVSSEGDAA